MNDRFVSFLLASRWASAVVVLTYHARFLLFVDYGSVSAKTSLSRAFYFFTGLGNEAFAVFVILDGIVGGLILRDCRSRAAVDRAAVSRHLAALFQIILPALVLGACFDLTGVEFFNRSGLYTGFPEFSRVTLSYSSLLGNLLMLQPFIVPTFGSNGMLFLLSYLFWCFILLLLFVRAARLGNPRGLYAQILLLAVVVLVMPYQFLIWGATWLAGVAVVFLGEAAIAKPSVPVAGACFAAAMMLSRLMGANTHLFPQPYGFWIIECKYLVVGISFAALAWALYPDKSWAREGGLLFPAVVTEHYPAGQSASFAFFCHFPVVMLLVAISSALLNQPIMQQPTPARYGELALLVGACLGITAVLARTVAIAMRIFSPTAARPSAPAG
jgi:hypothetical protein